MRTTTICRTQYRDERGRFVKGPAGAKAVALKAPKKAQTQKIKIFKASEGPKTQIQGSGSPGRVYRVRLVDAEVNRLRREAKAVGGEFYRGFLEWEREVRRSNAAEAQRLLREMRERLRTQAMEAEFIRERASRGGKAAARAKAEVKEKSAALRGLSTRELMERLRTAPSRAERKAAAAVLAERNISAPAKRKTSRKRR